MRHLRSRYQYARDQSPQVSRPGVSEIATSSKSLFILGACVPRSVDLGTAATRNIKNDFEDVARNEDLDRGDFSEVVFPHTRFLSPGQ